MLTVIGNADIWLPIAQGELASAPIAVGAKLHAPIPRPPKNVFCVGKNYHEHAKEFAGSGFDGGAANKLADISIHIPTEIGDYGVAEDAHSIVCHFLSAQLK